MKLSITDVCSRKYISLNCHSHGKISITHNKNQLNGVKQGFQECDAMSTVLAQGHFFSDSLSLHLTSKTHKVAMMMPMCVNS